MAIRDDRAEHANLSTTGSRSIQVGRDANGSTRSPVRRRLVRLFLVGAVAYSAVGVTGCSLTSGIFRSARRSGILDDCIMKYRNRVAAEKAWHCRKASFGAQAGNDVFKEGFIDGYIAVADGDDGCTPLVAPQKYWGWQYQSVAGQNAAGSWFGGYPLGVQAAEEDGLGSFRKLPFCDRPGVQGPGCNQCGPGQPGYIDPISDGYDINGYDADGYDRQGYDRDGYNVDGRLRADADPNDLERDRLGTDLDRNRDGIPDAARRSRRLDRDGNPRTGSGRVPLNQIDGPAVESDAGDATRDGFDSAPPPPQPRNQRSPFEDSIDNGTLDLSGQNFAPARPSDRSFDRPSAGPSNRSSDRSSGGSTGSDNATMQNGFDLGADFDARYTPKKLVPNSTASQSSVKPNPLSTRTTLNALNAPAGPVNIEASNLPVQNPSLVINTAKVKPVGPATSTTSSPAPIVLLDGPRIATRPPAMSLPAAAMSLPTPTNPVGKPGSGVPAGGVSTSLSDSTFSAEAAFGDEGVTIEQIFGISSEGGASAQLDDLPFSFE